MANVMLEILDGFSSISYEFWSTGIQSLHVFTSDFEFWIGVNEY